MDDMSEYMNQLNIASGEENLRGAAEGAAASAASAANLASGKLESISTGIGTPIGIAFLSSAAKSVATVGGQAVANTVGLGTQYTAVSTAVKTVGQTLGLTSGTSTAPALAAATNAAGDTGAAAAVANAAGDTGALVGAGGAASGGALGGATGVSAALDWNPVGVAFTAVLGIASILAGVFSHTGSTTARHVSVPVSNSSTQFGV